jgi:hypothetical protein
MAFIKQLCQEMAGDPRILTFTEIGKAAAKGALAGQKVNNALAGAVIGVSIIATERAWQISKELVNDLKHSKALKNS